MAGDSRIVTIDHQDSSKPDLNPSQWPEMKYGGGVKQRKAGDISYKLYLFCLIVLILVVLALYALYGRWCNTHYGACETWSAIWWNGLNIAGLAVVCAIVYGVYRHLYYSTERVRGDALRAQTERGRYGELVYLPMYQGMTIDNAAYLHMKQFAMSTQLERDIAPHKRYSGVQTLNEGDHSSVSTDIQAQPQIEAQLQSAMMPPLDWLPLLNDVDGEPHIMISGKTKAGKSTLAEVLLAWRVDRGDDIYIIDPHYQPVNKYGEVTWCGLRGVGGDSWESVNRALTAVRTEYERRKKEANDGRMPHGGFKPLTVIIDEAPEIYEELKKEWESFQGVMGSGARKYNIFIILLTQSHLIKDIGGSTAKRENFTIVALNEKARDLVESETRDRAQKEQLLDAMRGQPWTAAMLFRGDVLLLNRTGIKDMRRETLDAPLWEPPQQDEGLHASDEDSVLPSRLRGANVKVQIAWLAANTDLGTRRIREIVQCDYNTVVDVCGKVRGPSGTALRKRFQTIAV